MNNRDAVPLHNCPHCRTEMDSAYCINADAKPKDGDPGVCSVCGKVMVYEGGSVRKPTLDEMVEFLMIEEFLVAMIAAGRMVRLKKSRLN